MKFQREPLRQDLNQRLTQPRAVVGLVSCAWVTTMRLPRLLPVAAALCAVLLFGAVLRFGT